MVSSLIIIDIFFDPHLLIKIIETYLINTRLFKLIRFFLGYFLIDVFKFSVHLQYYLQLLILYSWNWKMDNRIYRCTNGKLNVLPEYQSKIEWQSWQTRRQIDEWFEHFRDISGTSESEPKNPNVPTVDGVQLLVAWKLPEIGQITTEKIKSSAKLSTRTLHPIFSKRWEDRQFPEEWLQGRSPNKNTWWAS